MTDVSFLCSSKLLCSQHPPFCVQVNLLGAAPTKATALTTPLTLAVAALLVAGTFGLALASGSWGTGAAIATERNEVFARSGCNRSSCSRAAGKFRAAASSV